MKYLLIILLLFHVNSTRSQIQVSLGTDVTVMRNFSPGQKFWAFGQTIHGDFHFSRKETGYASLVYYSPGNFRNTFTATAKSPQTTPSRIDYTVTGEWRLREVSLGWKHYFKGGFNEVTTWNMYGMAGFGLVFTKTLNTFNPVDTALYIPSAAPVAGEGEFKRLTLDVGLGVEMALGGNFYAYGEAKTWLRASDYPSVYLHNTKNVPLPAIVCAGLRILFGY